MYSRSPTSSLRQSTSSRGASWNDGGGR
jgi:hypothetical protein